MVEVVAEDGLMEVKVELRPRLVELEVELRLVAEIEVNIKIEVYFKCDVRVKLRMKFGLMSRLPW